MKAHRAKVTPLVTHVPRTSERGLETPDTSPTDWPRFALAETARGPVPVLVEYLTRPSTYDRKRMVYHATVCDSRAGHKRGERLWVDVRACTWITEAEVSYKPSGAARRRARKRATSVRKSAPTAAPVSARETRLPTIYEQGASVDK